MTDVFGETGFNKLKVLFLSYSEESSGRQMGAGTVAPQCHVIPFSEWLPHPQTWPPSSGQEGREG